MVKEIKIEKMDELIEALGGGGGSDLPTPTSEDNGKVLGVVNGAYALKADEGLPSMSQSDDGKVLQAVYNDKSARTEAQWVTPEIDTTGAQAGQVLTAIEDMGGNIITGWTTPDTGLPSISSSDNGKVLQATYDDKSGTGSAEWVTPSGGDMPAYVSGNAGDVPAINDTYDGLVWRTIYAPSHKTTSFDYPNLASTLYSGKYEMIVKSGGTGATNKIQPGFIVTCRVNDSVEGTAWYDVNISNCIFQSAVSGKLEFPSQANLLTYLVSCGIISETTNKFINNIEVYYD